MTAKTKELIIKALRETPSPETLATSPLDYLLMLAKASGYRVERTVEEGYEIERVVRPDGTIAVEARRQVNHD